MIMDEKITAEATTDFSQLLSPRGVAIVGASREPGKRGHQTLVDLEKSGYDGEIYPVNPKYEGKIQGHKVYQSVSEIPGPVDLAFIATPASTVPSILEECGSADIAGAVIIAAGFSEAGADDLEAQTLEMAREHDIRLFGPNIQGIANLHEGLNLLGGYDVPTGNLALLSQSGNVGLELGSHAAGRCATGFSFNIGIGNETDMKFHEFLPYLNEHEQTDAIIHYVDGMTDARAFLREAQKVSTETPIVVLKGGITNVGQNSAQSHTGSLAGEGAVVDAAYQQAGVIRAEHTDEAVAIADTLAKLPPASGKNVAVLTDGGGNATISADALVQRGFNLPKFTESTRERLQGLVPDAPNLSNPIDMMGLQGDGDLSIFFDCAEAIVSDPNVDSLLLTGVFGGYEEFGPGDSDSKQEADVAREIAALTEEYKVPIAVHCIYSTQGSKALDAFETSGVPTFASLDNAVTSLEKLSQYGEHLNTVERKSDFCLDLEKENDNEIISEALATGRTTLSEHESRKVLQNAGISPPPFELATTSEEAARAAETFEGPVAMKVVSPDIVHKSDAGGVCLNVNGSESAAGEFDRILENTRQYAPEASIDGVLVTPMVDGNREFIIGVTRDDEVGPVIMFGVGGIFVEVLEDVSFRALPLTEYDANSLLDEIDTQELLHGVRGEPGVDRDSLVDLLLDVSSLIKENPAITELDLNPVFADEDGVTIIDASITLSSID